MEVSLNLVKVNIPILKFGLNSIETRQPSVSGVLWSGTGVGWQCFCKFTKKGFIYGKPMHTVKIYVELHHNSPFPVCMDIKCAKNKQTNKQWTPTYLWIVPNENPLTRTYWINITQTGKLMVKDFLETLSGLHTCPLSYKTVISQTQEKNMVKQRYDFVMFAYQEPDHSWSDWWLYVLPQSLAWGDIMNCFSEC